MLITPKHLPNYPFQILHRRIRILHSVSHDQSRDPLAKSLDGPMSEVPVLPPFGSQNIENIRRGRTTPHIPKSFLRKHAIDRHGEYRVESTGSQMPHNPAFITILMGPLKWVNLFVRRTELQREFLGGLTALIIPLDHRHIAANP